MCNDQLPDPLHYFSLIFSDIYGTDGVDDLQLQERYLDQCLQCLTDDGWLVLNCWKEHLGDASILPILKQRFNDVRTCVTQSGNWVILAGRKRARERDRHLRERKIALVGAAWTVAAHIKDEHVEKAKKNVKRWFGDDEELT